MVMMRHSAVFSRCFDQQKKCNIFICLAFGGYSKIRIKKQLTTSKYLTLYVKFDIKNVYLLLSQMLKFITTNNIKFVLFVKLHLGVEIHKK